MSRKLWTDEELGFLEENRHLTARQVGEILDRGKQSVQHMRRKLANGEVPDMSGWSEADDDFVRTTPHMRAVDVAAALGRTTHAVTCRRARLTRLEGITFGNSAKADPHVVGLRRLLAKTCIKCGVLLDASFFRPEARGYRSECTRCKPKQKMTPQRSKKTAASGRKYIDKMQAFTLPHAHKGGQPWVGDDHKVLRDPDLLMVEKALKLGRSYIAVATQCSNHGYKSRVGQLDPETGRWVIDNPNEPKGCAA